jgi:hypothetical protein
VGTDTPGYKFDVDGQARFGGSTGLVFGVGTAFATGQAEVYSTSTTPMGLGTTGSAILRLYTNSTLQATLDTSGNLGLGVTPSAWGSSIKALEGFTTNSTWSIAAGGGLGDAINIQSNAYYDGSNWIYKASATATNYYQNLGAHAWRIAASGTAGGTISWTQAMTLDASGNLGLLYDKALLFKNSTGTDRQILAYANDTYLDARDGGIILRTGTGGSATERARITSGGDVLFGTTNSSVAAGAGFKFIPDGLGAGNPLVGIVGVSSSNAEVTYRLYSTGAADYRFYVGFGGTVFATNTTISAISDQRFKENIRDLDIGLDAVLALKPRKFDWKEGKGKNIKNDRGFIAQELEQIFPDLIDDWQTPAPEGEEPYKSVRQDLIPVLVKAIQEQQAMIEDLKAKVVALESK